jgi:MYXO-CTERM domain-containing protein
MGGTVPSPGMTAFLTAYTPSSVDLGTASLSVDQLNNYPNGFVITLSHSSTSAGGSYTTNVDPITTNFPDPADIHLVLTTSLSVTPSTPTFNLAARITTLTAFNHANDLGDQLLYSAVDFGNSAHLSLMIPDGVPWTSASGVFLQSAPEPGAAAQAAAALAALLGCVSVRRRRAATR